MAKVLLSIEEFRKIEKLKNDIHSLQETVRDMSIFYEPTSCWNTEKDVVRACTLEETKELVKMILAMNRFVL